MEKRKNMYFFTVFELVYSSIDYIRKKVIPKIEKFTCNLT